jgi:hypothetical protein
MSFFSNLFHGNSTGGNIFNALFDPAGITGIGNSLFPGKKKAGPAADQMITNAQLPTFNANMGVPASSPNYWSQGNDGNPQFNVPNFWPSANTPQQPAQLQAPGMAGIVGSPEFMRWFQSIGGQK